MKISRILIYIFAVSLLSIPVTADLMIDKTEVIQTTDREIDSPAWSPDGNSIAYIALDSSARQQIFTINIDGTGRKQVTTDPYKKWSVKWLKEGIFYLSYDTDESEKIFIVQPDGSARKKLLDDNTRQGRAPWDKLPEIGGMSWNAEIQKVLFTSFDSMANEKIFEVGIDGTGKKQLIDDTSRQWNPDWGPDGKSFVYVSYDSRNKEQLFIAKADGTGKTQITSDDIKKSDPNWGQDGILFVSHESISSIGEKIFIINPDGTGKRLLIGDGFKQINPRWSPDWNRILYEDIDIQGNKKLTIISLKKTEVTSTPTEVMTPSPSTSPAATPTLPVKETPGEKPNEPDAMKEVLSTMLLILALVVLVMLVILVISNISKKK